MPSPAPEINDPVTIFNRESIWHNEIGIVRDIKETGFCRVELLGSLIWLPTHWLIVIDDEFTKHH